MLGAGVGPGRRSSRTPCLCLSLSLCLLAPVGAADRPQTGTGTTVPGDSRRSSALDSSIRGEVAGHKIDERVGVFGVWQQTGVVEHDKPGVRVACELSGC